jgi:hypothetical protein
LPELDKSPYSYLLEDADFKRWFSNVRRGSVATAHEWLRRMGFVRKRFKKTPKEIASLSPKHGADFLMDIVSALEGEGRSGNYIANCIKPLKSWLEFNGVTIQERIKSGRGETPTRSDERPPIPDELKKILAAADLRTKTACSLVAFSGVRLEVLGDYLGDDGLEVRDFPEMKMKGDIVDFGEIPARIDTFIKSSSLASLCT